MKYTKFGKTGIEVSKMCLGTWGIGGAGWDNYSDESRMDAIKAALDCGINFIDTAPAYNAGKAEQYVGETLHKLGARKEVVISTKCGNEFIDGKYVRCGSADKILRECDESLQNLKTDYIDVYLVHWPDPNVAMEETMDALNQLKKQGKILHAGVSNFTKEQMEEAKRRDHNKLGREMKIFTTVDVIGQGLPLIMPNGVIMMQELQRWIEDEEAKRGYIRTKTPLMAKSDLYKISGHWDHYKDGMFVLGDEEKDKEVYALRPMTCPFQYYVYKAEQHSYRDLPLRYGETSTLFRNEDSGEMHGLTRVRQFTISEGHLIVRPDQMVKEFKDCIALAQYCLQVLGVEEDVTYHLSKWDPNNREKYIGDAEVWNQTEAHIRQMLEELNIPFTEDVGEAAFYGPKVDINAKNVYGKEDTMITIQWDALLAEQFDMYYIDENGEKQRPYIIHRTSMGCYERTLAWLIEKYAGMFPTWLCPEQVRVIPISDKYNDYAAKVEAQLKEANIRCSVDGRSEKMGYKIREARLNRVPYMLIVGAKEEEEQKVSVRSRYLGDEGSKDLGEFIEAIKDEIAKKTIRKIEVEE